MGLIKDAIGSALGANQVKNGFNGPNMRLPRTNAWGDESQVSAWNLHQQQEQGVALSSNSLYPSQVCAPSYQTDPLHTPLHPMGYSQATSDLRDSYPEYYNEHDDSYPRERNPLPPDYFVDFNQQHIQTDSSFQPLCRSSQNREFRPLALPQIDYGDGKPFLRAYSNDLLRFGISQDGFFRHLDAINTAIIPNPENQIFQKAANIAGWFVPGAAGIGLMAGQVVVGIGAAFGHASYVNRALSTANLLLFLPNGLEICIGRGSDVDTEVDTSSFSTQQLPATQVMSPIDRVSRYGNLVAPLSIILEPSRAKRRNDPVAIVGRTLGDRGDQKKTEKASKDLAKGKSKKSNALECDLKWLMVRRATPDALQRWRETLQQSSEAIEQEQAAP